MKKIIDVVVDLETLSLRENAAIISIAAVPFIKRRLENGLPASVPYLAKDLEIYAGIAGDGLEPYYEVVNATTCALIGMHFDEKTVDFWKNQPDPAKAELLTENSISIRCAIEGFIKHLTALKVRFDADIRLWSQGSDFDIPILRCAIRMALNEMETPWKHNDVRDARTWILEHVEWFHGDLEKPYSIFPEHPELTKHSTLGDATRTALNIIDINDHLQTMIDKCQNT